VNFLADENIHSEIVTWLRSRGHDVVYAAESLCGAPDEDLLALARNDEHSSPGHVKTLRESLGLTQQELANKLRVTSQTISRWERGDTQPSAAALKKLRKIQLSARKTGVTVKTGASRHRPDR